MKQNIIPSIRLTLVCLVVFCVAYPALIRAIAFVTPSKGQGQTVSVNGKIVGYTLEGQKFTEDKYFSSRPSAVDYNAAGSAGSNKGPTNPDYLKQVAERVDSFLVHNPSVSKQHVPSELVTASGSGLDPDLSPAGAKVQAERIAQTRHLPVEKINKLIQDHIQQPFLNVAGTERINVLQLNIDLDKLK